VGSHNCANEILALPLYACLWMIALGSSSHCRGPPPGIALPPRPLLLHPRENLPMTMGNSNLRLPKPSYLGVCCDVTGGRVASHNCEDGGGDVTCSHTLGGATAGNLAGAPASQSGQLFSSNERKHASHVPSTPSLLFYACLWMIALGSSSHCQGPPPGIALPPRPLLLHPRDNLPMTMGNSNLRLPKPSYLGVCCDVTGGRVGSHICANEILALLFYACLWMIVGSLSTDNCAWFLDFESDFSVGSLFALLSL
jgi:hypothetical protein